MEKAYVKDKEENIEVRWVLRIRVKLSLLQIL